MPPTEWYQDNFLVSTSPSLLQVEAINAAFESDMMYWAKRMDESVLTKMLKKSLCFGVYVLPSSSSDIAGKSGPRQVGLARLITDEVSFAYLTDVYVLKEYQGAGLGQWLIKCVDEHLSTWPDLRRMMLYTGRKSTIYEDLLGMKPFPEGEEGMLIYNKRCQGSVFSN